MPSEDFELTLLPILLHDIQKQICVWIRIDVEVIREQRLLRHILLGILALLLVVYGAHGLVLSVIEGLVLCVDGVQLLSLAVDLRLILLYSCEAEGLDV